MTSKTIYLVPNSELQYGDIILAFTQAGYSIIQVTNDEFKDIVEAGILYMVCHVLPCSQGKFIESVSVSQFVDTKVGLKKVVRWGWKAVPTGPFAHEIPTSFTGEDPK